MNSFSRFAAAVATFVAMVPAAGAAGQVQLSVAGGPSFPVGHLGDEFQLGYRVQTSAGLSVPLPIGFRVDAAYTHFPETHGSFRNISGTANGIVNLGGIGVSPYLIGGLGVYNSRVSHDEDDEHDHDHADGSTTNLGVNFGAGVRMPLPGLTLFVEARLHNLFSEGEQTRFIPLSFGFAF